MTRALLIIDLQKGVTSTNAPLYKLEQVLDGVNQRIQTYRQIGDPIIFIQHEDAELEKGSAPWQLLPSLAHQPTDYYCGKTHANAFYQTNLAVLLSELGINQLEICGAQVEYCVDTTIRFAHGLGYELTMKKGLTTTTDSTLFNASQIIAHHESIWENRFLTFI